MKRKAVGLKRNVGLPKPKFLVAEATTDLSWDDHIYCPYAAPQLNNLFGYYPHIPLQAYGLSLHAGLPTFIAPRYNNKELRKLLTDFIASVVKN